MKQSHANPITERYYAAIRMCLKTPLCIAGEGNESSDKTVLLDGMGEPFIPGSSVAGAIRSYLDLQKDKAGAMGFSSDNFGQMSPIFISDMRFYDNPSIGQRDFVRLDHEKTAVSNAKFNMEIVEDGAETVLYLEAVNRKRNPYLFESIFQSVVDGFASGEIRLGSKKNRGFGWLEVKKAKFCVFRASDLEKWLDFVPDWKKRIFEYPDAKDLNPAQAYHNKYIDMILPLKQEGGISVRVYSARAGKADYAHLMSNGRPVIPGTSWNGAVREHIYKILRQIGVKEPAAEGILEEWFGYVQTGGERKRTENEEPDACQSRIIYEESKIHGGNSLPMTRTRIDRFDQATAGTALYTEETWVGGTTDLHIKIRRQHDESDLAIVGMLMLIFDDIENGYVAVGGQTAVGRGVFTADHQREKFESQLDRTQCLKALYAFLRREVSA